MEKTIFISEVGKNYKCGDNETPLKEYDKSNTKFAHDIAIKKAISYPHFGFRCVILDNKNVLIVGTKRK